MKPLLELIRLYGVQLSAAGSAVVFIIGLLKYLIERKEAHYWKEFEVYHRLIKELVEGEKPDAQMYADRQAAIIFELRNFKRYYPCSLRSLKGLRKYWSRGDNEHPRIFEELDLSIAFVEKQLQRKQRFRRKKKNDE